MNEIPGFIHIFFSSIVIYPKATKRKAPVQDALVTIIQ
ncbi:hypothetical protein NIES2104_36540 [Leptolyngbya sp. NIES-2104]|nr:hypothetical protein NIES2104_36540 [Leptolyngbya sp. NIES-2104]